MDMTIELRGLEVYAHHGCYAEERTVGGRFVVDADLVVESGAVAATDDVSTTLNYVDACRLVAEVLGLPRNTLEAIAADVARRMAERFAARGLRGGWVSVRKFAPPIGLQVGSVGVKVAIPCGA